MLDVLEFYMTVTDKSGYQNDIGTQFDDLTIHEDDIMSTSPPRSPNVMPQQPTAGPGFSYTAGAGGPGTLPRQNKPAVSLSFFFPFFFHHTENITL